ncbi:MAG: bifunctional DNA primase/polymerase [Paracoccaceae bacterium]
MRFASGAARLFDNGYEPLPILPGSKRPAVARWSGVGIDGNRLEAWRHSFRDHGIGLRTGTLVGLDIDEGDPDVAHAIGRLAERRLGATLVRVGLWPKRLLVYRAEAPFRKLKSGSVEVLGAGQQFVAFGHHPATGRDYYWVGETPLDVALTDLPAVETNAVEAFLAELPHSDPGEVGSRSRVGTPRTPPANRPDRDERGLVIDGRDGWLSTIAYHAVQDIRERGDRVDPECLAEQTWQRFVATTELARPCAASGLPYGRVDAVAKVRAKLRLAAEGRLPGRDRAPVEPAPAPPILSVEAGRARLAGLLEGFRRDVLAWHGDASRTTPALGLRATVGLGKSRMAMRMCLDLARTLREGNLPSRILVFTPSLGLADEAAEAWRNAGARAVVARGYERTDPVSGGPMCRDIELVRAAIASRLPIQDTVCRGRDGVTCRHIAGCAKQRNRREVAAADVVFTAYDALFTGLALDHDDIALLLVDESCWARAVETRQALSVEEIADEPVADMRGSAGRASAAMADLSASRTKLVSALVANGAGPLSRKGLRDAGLTTRDCRLAARFELSRITDPGLRPDLGTMERDRSLRLAARNARAGDLALLWTTLADGIGDGDTAFGRVSIAARDANGRHRIDLSRLRGLHVSLAGKPILHLDATLRPELARTVLPGLAVESVDVAAPHMSVHLVAGRFGKATLCPAPGLPEAERLRRARRLAECVDHVHWHARRLHPAPVLVLTYKAIEEAFAGLPNVVTGHFNAIAGLDLFREVGAVFVIGRPQPARHDLERLCAALFDHVPAGGYRQGQAGVALRSGHACSLPVLRHSDPTAEILRAAICDDEIVQAIGRGRGVNRTACSPLVVHVLGDVVPPVLCERVTAWDALRPDILQRMLLAGFAVDSPADAVVLHPTLFANAEQAKKALERAGFKGQTPLGNSYREMSLKSATYRRPGRGRSWQRAWWIEANSDATREGLEAALGPLAGWIPGDG